MCGDLDEDDRIDEELFDRFLHLAGHYGVEPRPTATNTPANLADEATRAAYMNGLFKAGLARAVDDASHLPQGTHMDAVAGQAIVFARLAGFLAGQFPPQADLFRTVLAALMEGHREGGKAG